jgi:hypothetical protein
MGAALTYARRYALFALVGIAGEDDLDAPDILNEPAIDAPDDANPGAPTSRKPPNGSIHKPRQPKPILAAEASAVLRDLLIAEVQNLTDGEDIALWAHRCLPAKNTLTADDARAVEAACQVVLSALIVGEDEPAASIAPTNESGSDARTAAAEEENAEAMVTPLRKQMRRRNKAHLVFVAAQPCLVCRRSPCDAHHLKFAQPRSLGRKVSDEFTVPLCREHHVQLHHYGSEMAWWANLQIDALKEAKELWSATVLPAGDRMGLITGQSSLGREPDPANSADGNTVGRVGP